MRKERRTQHTNSVYSARYRPGSLLPGTAGVSRDGSTVDGQVCNSSSFKIVTMEAEVGLGYETDSVTLNVMMGSNG